MQTVFSSGSTFSPGDVVVSSTWAQEEPLKIYYSCSSREDLILIVPKRTGGLYLTLSSVREASNGRVEEGQLLLGYVCYLRQDYTTSKKGIIQVSEDAA